jgi:ParB/RepB/Spo0J family partition protein
MPGAPGVGHAADTLLIWTSASKSRPGATRWLRRLRNDVVDELATSMQEIGQLHPILVGEADSRLIAGWHRFEAAEKLGWTRIKAILVDDRSADLMLMMEIDENLVRADLSPAERAAHQAER